VTPADAAAATPVAAVPAKVWWFFSFFIFPLDSLSGETATRHFNNEQPERLTGLLSRLTGLWDKTVMLLSVNPIKTLTHVENPSGC
jgi:hypothetical protein